MEKVSTTTNLIIEAGANVLSELIADNPHPINFNRVVNDFKSGLVMQALKETNGNQAKAAKFIGTTRTTIRTYKPKTERE